MTDNDIRVGGAKAMSEALKANTTLTTLHVRSGSERSEKEKRE